ncbi:hypothetical protein [Candidatus Thioglobus sp.]|uniref:hypothetical protein n=1 Tax=Candidatus Thioglobus sp. TaxID=2026721 RepID=UPI003D0B611B
MLDGIDYYPAKSKKKFKLSIWIFSFIVLLLSAYFIFKYFPEAQQNPNKQTLIIVSKAKKPVENLNTSIIIKSSNSYQPEIDQRVKSDKGLDELIQKFKQQ